MNVKNECIMGTRTSQPNNNINNQHEQAYPKSRTRKNLVASSLHIDHNDTEMIKSLYSEAEKKFVIHGVEQGVRQDGRSLLDLRHLDVKVGVIASANGSARIRQPFSGTQLLTGVKMQVGVPEPDHPTRGRLEVSVDCSSLLPLYPDNFAMDQLSAQLSQHLEQTLKRSGALDHDELCIVPGQSCWVVFVDVLVLGYAGNLTDLICLSAYCALKNATIPATSVIQTEQGPDFEIVPDVGSAKGIRCEGIPLCVTLSLVGDRVIVDATPEEEACISASMSVLVNEGGLFCGMSKSGMEGIEPAQLPKLFKTAQGIVKELFTLVSNEVKQENDMQLKLKYEPNLFATRDHVTLTRTTWFAEKPALLS